MFFLHDFLKYYTDYRLVWANTKTVAMSYILYFGN